jgi:hypothetical protein
MSEVDRLSNSGLYPALPIADKRGSNNDSSSKARTDARTKDDAKSEDTAETGRHPKPPKSLIDEYA